MSRSSPVLTEEKLEHIEDRIPGHDTVRNYRHAVEQCKKAVRNGDRKGYETWSGTLERLRRNMERALQRYERNT